MNYEDTSEQTLQGRYEQLRADRQPFLDRAREASTLTIPQIFPPEGKSGRTKLKTPYQGIGALAVNSLTAKILLAILPANQSFFRFDIDEITMAHVVAQAQNQGDPNASGQIKVWNEGLAKSERTVQRSISASTLRAKLAEGLKQLVIGGNSLLYIESPKVARVYRLDTYCVKLDSIGNLIEIVVKESVNILTLTADIRATCQLEYKRGHSEDVDVYTGVQLQEDGRYETWQEINKIRVPGTEGHYPLDKLPWLPLRWATNDGESYSHSYVDQYIGDLQSLEGLYKANVQGAAAAAKVVFLVKPGSAATKRALASVANGGFIDGNPGDVAALQLDKYHDFRVATETASNIENRLRYAFLMTSSIQRNGDRVTAEEIRLLANELEDQLGGIYSVLSQSLQFPLVNIIVAAMTRDKSLPPLPKGLVQISITTGLDALGRGQDADRLAQFKADIADIPGAPQAVKMPEFVSRFAIARGIDTDGLIKTDQEMQQEQQQAQMQEFMQKAGTAVAPDVVKAGLAGQQQQGQPPEAAPQ